MRTDVLRNLADGVAFTIVIWAQWRIAAWALSTARWNGAARAAVATVAIWLAAGLALNTHVVVNAIEPPSWLRGIVSGGAYLWAFSTTAAYLLFRGARTLANRNRRAAFDPDRRKLLGAATHAMIAAPVAVTGFGALVTRTDFGVREVDLPIPNLPPDLRGLRILQLTDIHLGPFLSERDLERVIDESRNLRAHLAVVTGDLISMAGDPLDACLRQIARLRPDAGILGCMGNHEAFAEAERYTAEQGARLGIDFLRSRARPLRFGAATLNVAGVDYESVAYRKNYIAGAERLVKPGAVNLLLSHNPDVFPTAARKGFQYTLAGHTHGGQVTIEILNQSLNVARFITPFVYGRYTLERAGAALYVSRGIGTIGLPVRIGAPPEISLLRLTAG